MSILRGNQIKHKKLEADQKRTKALLQRKMDWVGREWTSKQSNLTNGSGL